LLLNGNVHLLLLEPQLVHVSEQFFLVVEVEISLALLQFQLLLVSDKLFMVVVDGIS
jgi:hypothetical protein